MLKRPGIRVAIIIIAVSQNSPSDCNNEGESIIVYMDICVNNLVQLDAE